MLFKWFGFPRIVSKNTPFYGYNFQRNVLATVDSRAPQLRAASSCSEKGLYELRTYSIVPGKLGELSELITKNFHLRTAHSKLVGFWTSEIGGLNQVVHVWYYESLQQRAAVRAALASDADWQSIFISRAAPTWQHQENLLMAPLEGTHPSDPQDRKGVYELHNITMAGRPQDWAAAITSFSSVLTKAAGGPCLVGAWRPVLGPRNSAVLLFQYADIDGILRSQQTVAKEAGDVLSVAREWKTKLLLPHAVSPLL